MIWKPTVVFRARLLLVLLAIILPISTFILHRRFLGARRRSYEEPARAHLVGNSAPRRSLAI
jgi:hypothetical protein